MDEYQSNVLSVELIVKAADNCYGSYVLLDELLNRHVSKARHQKVLEQLAGPHGRTVCRTLAVQRGIDLSTYQKGEPVRYTANTDGD